jgi:hypothetical protein
VAFTEFWLGRVKRKREVMIALGVKAMQRVAWRPVAETRRARAKMASQLAEPRQVSAKRSEQAKLAGLETAPVM